MISCHLHDYIEIACLYSYQIELELLNGKRIQGKAITTETSKEKKEYMVIENDNETQRIDTSSIKAMLAITENNHFSRVEFS